MTPAIIALEKAAIPFEIHEYDHDPGSQSFGQEAADKLGVSADRIFKTLVASLDNGHLAVGIIPVACTLDLKKLAAACGCKKAKMADPRDAERSTGYVTGGISPVGQRKRLETVIDIAAKCQNTVFVSAGRRGLEIELTAADLAHATDAAFADIARPD